MVHFLLSMIRNPILNLNQSPKIRWAAVVIVVSGLVLTMIVGISEVSRINSYSGGSHLNKVGTLRVNGLTNPLAIGASAPMLSWTNHSDGRGFIQNAYEVRVAADERELEDSNVWSSGKVDSADQTNIVYGGPALQSQSRYVWQVRTWDNSGQVSSWAIPASFETGLLSDAEWLGNWIGGVNTAGAPVAAWADYTVDVTFQMDSLVLGLYGRASDTSNAYMWQLSVADGTPRFRPHVKQNGTLDLLDNRDISNVISKADLLAGRHVFRVQYVGTTIVASLDGKEIDRRNDVTFSEGSIGFRASQATEGSERSTIYSVKVVSSDGTTLLDTDFSDGQNPFVGGSVIDRSYQVSSPVESLLQSGTSEPLLRKDFPVSKTITSARAYASALGVYELSLNGVKIGDRYLAPGWTDYDKRVTYQTYDVTGMVSRGVNTLGAMLARGWYAGNIGIFGPEHYGTTPSLYVQLRIEYSDGTHDVIKSDSSWRTIQGPLASSDMIMGESYDASRLPADWNMPTSSTALWDPVTLRSDAPTALLQPQPDAPVRATEVRTGSYLTKQPTTGVYLYDMKQNMVGVPQLTLSGVAGQTVTIRFGEMLQPDGSLYTANLRSAKATDYYTFAGTGTVTYTPKFTFHGFRYLEISGLQTAPPESGVKGLVLGTDNATTGSLSTSDAMLNQLQSNIVWGQRGNFLSIPTDTPARDERLGWTGDINVFAPTASYNQNTYNFLAKWLVDLRDAQLPNGDFPAVAPDPIGFFAGGPGWSDANITVTSILWKVYGNTEVVSAGYASMAKFMDYLRSASPGFIRTDGALGDWLHANDPTDQALIGTAYYAYDARLMSQMATALGKYADAALYAELESDITRAFRTKYLMEDGTVLGNSQTGYALAIGMGLIPQNRMAQVGTRFVAKVEAEKYHLSTGFLGTPWLLQALTDSGYADIAYRLLNNTDYPSWGYEVASGATTMWERWDSLNPDGSFGDVDMNSFNHYAYGAVGDWMYRNIGGISSSAAGYKSIVIAPIVGGGLTSGTGSFDSVYGVISSDWKVQGSVFSLKTKIPANTTAVIKIPAASRFSIMESGKPARFADGVTNVAYMDGTVEITVGSGSYSFIADQGTRFRGQR